MRCFWNFFSTLAMVLMLAAPTIAEEFSVSDASNCNCNCSCNCCEDSCEDCCKPLLFGLIAPTDLTYCDFISPMTNPVFFEDPRTLTEARIIYAHHKLPPALGADSINVMAMQLRAAITDRLSIIATKDGFITSDSPLLNDGWADIAAGLKYNLYSDPCKRQLLSAGVTYEGPWGSTRALQGNGDGEFNLFMTGAAQTGSGIHWISASGLRLPTDSAAESRSTYWSNHFDKQILRDNIYFLTEFNVYHWLKSGKGGVPGVEGLDFFNLGSTGVAGNTIVTGAFGFKYKPTALNEIGVCWEVPLSDRRDVLDNRLTADIILRYYSHSAPTFEGSHGSRRDAQEVADLSLCGA